MSTARHPPQWPRQPRRLDRLGKVLLARMATWRKGLMKSRETPLPSLGTAMSHGARLRALLWSCCDLGLACGGSG